MLFIHSTTGRSFTSTGPGEFGASVRGTWDSGQTGVIFPAEVFRDGSRVWTERHVCGEAS